MPINNNYVCTCTVCISFPTYLSRTKCIAIWSIDGIGLKVCSLWLNLIMLVEAWGLLAVSTRVNSSFNCYKEGKRRYHTDTTRIWVHVHCYDTREGLGGGSVCLYSQLHSVPVGHPVWLIEGRYPNHHWHHPYTRRPGNDKCNIIIFSLLLLHAFILLGPLDAPCSLLLDSRCVLLANMLVDILLMLGLWRVC